MKSTLIPKSKLDRFFAVFALFTVPGIFFAIQLDMYWAAWVLAACEVGLLVMVYVFPAQHDVSASVDEYSAVIERISAIGKQLTDLNGFLEKERARIADIEATVRNLNDEKTKLEPVVNTHRETVEAILAAHSARTARQAWKERVFGFALGVIASLIASFVYEYFKR